MREYEVCRSGAGYPIDEAREKFKELGLIVLKRYLDGDTQDPIRSVLTEKLDAARGRGAVRLFPEYPQAEFLLGDILSVRGLEKYDYIFFKPELVALLKALLNSSDLVYYGDSSTQFGAAARGFHKDNVDRGNANPVDWAGDYSLIRCAFYCEDHSRHSGGLKVRLRSHELENTRSRSDRDKISHHAGKAIDVSSEYGDLVMWNMRLTHSGNFLKLKGFPGLCLHPRFEGILPAALAVKEPMRRYFMSCSLARPGGQLERYIENMLRRVRDYRAYLERARHPAESREILAPRGVTFRQPCDYYARLDTSA